MENTHIKLINTKIKTGKIMKLPTISELYKAIPEDHEIAQTLKPLMDSKSIFVAYFTTDEDYSIANYEELKKTAPYLIVKDVLNSTYIIAAPINSDEPYKESADYLRVFKKDFDIQGRQFVQDNMHNFFIDAIEEMENEGYCEVGGKQLIEGSLETTKTFAIPLLFS